MNISKTKILIFFAAIILMTWMLYPRELFMAYIYEGKADLEHAENYYLGYLGKHPHNKFATLRLAGLYERMAKPEQAIQLLLDLLKHRPKDWKVAQTYLDVLRYTGPEKKWMAEQIRLARYFATVPRFPKGNIKMLLDDVLDYTLWHQDLVAADLVLAELIQLKKKWAKDYLDTRIYLARVQKHTDRVIGFLVRRLDENPNDAETREDLAEILTFSGKDQEALLLLDEGLVLKPDFPKFLEIKWHVLVKLKRWDEALALSKKLLSQDGLDLEKRVEYLEGFAFLFDKQNKWEMEIEVYQAILKIGGERQKYLPDLAQTLTKAKQFKRAFAAWREYLDLVPGDHEAFQSAAALALYDLKDAGQWGFYRSYLAATHDALLAEDLLYFYLAAKMSADFEQELFLFLRQEFPEDVKITDAYVDYLVEHKKEQLALPLALSLYKSRPHHPAWILRLAAIYYSLGDFKQAARFYRILGKNGFDDFATVKLVGRELYFLGQVDRALVFLDRAVELNPRDPEVWFWRQECFVYKLDRKRTRINARQAVALFSRQLNLTLEQKRLFLKSRARLKFDKAVRADYLSLIRHSPKDRDLRADFLDELLVAKEAHKAGQQIQKFKKNFPAHIKMMRPYEVRLAFLRRQWDVAARLLEAILDEDPLQIAYRKDLANVRFRQGYWRQAIHQYEEVLRIDPTQDAVKTTVHEIRDDKDHQIRTEFKWTDFGADEFWTLTGHYQGYGPEKLKLGARFTYGDFTSGSLGLSDQIQSGGLRADYRLLPELNLGAEISGGHSGQRNTLTPALHVDWQVLEALKLSASGSWHELRSDFSQALVRGVLMDVSRVNLFFTASERVFFTADYEWTRNLLPGGAKSIGHSVEPSLVFIVHKKQPYFTLGYQFSFADHSDEGGFLSLVSLVPRRESHFLVGYLSHDFGARVRLDAGFFAGEDTARNLHLFAGDLFGVNSQFIWRVFPWMNLATQYQYGRETLSGVGGNAHLIQLSLTGHWL